MGIEPTSTVPPDSGSNMSMSINGGTSTGTPPYASSPTAASSQSNRVVGVGNSSSNSSSSSSPLHCKPPLVSLNKSGSSGSIHSTMTATTTEPNLLIERGERYSFSGYGRPDEFLTPSSGKRRSWRPKFNNANNGINIGSTSKGTAVWSKLASGVYCSSPKNSSNHSSSTSSFCSSTAHDLASTPENGSSKGRIPRAAALLHTILPASPPLALADDDDNDEQVLPVSPGQRPSIDALTASPSRQNQSQNAVVERIRPATRDKFTPSRLRRKWPPIATVSAHSSSTGTYGGRNNEFLLSLLQTLGAVCGGTVKERRLVFEKDVGNDVITKRNSTTTTTLDLALGIVQNESNNNNAAVKSREDHQLLQQVRELLSDKMAVPPIITTTVSEVELGQEELTQGELLSKLKVKTSMKIRWGGPTYYTIEGRPPRVNHNDDDDHDANANDNYHFAPPLIDDRFGAFGSSQGLLVPPSRGRDTALARPMRSLDDWSDDESFYSQDHDDDAVERAEETTVPTPRPSIWIAPLLNEQWRVKRLWDEPSMDIQEPEYLVHEDELLQKVKVLLGVPLSPVDASSADAAAHHQITNTPRHHHNYYDPEADSWCMKKVYDVNGEIQGVSETMKINERGISLTFQEVARTASFAMDVVDKENDDDDEKKIDTIVDVDTASSTTGGENCTGNVGGLLPVLLQNEAGGSEPRGDSTTSSDNPTPAIPSSSLDSPNAIASKNKKGRKSKKEQEDNASLWDLLSPHPVMFILDDH